MTGDLNFEQAIKALKDAIAVTANMSLRQETRVKEHEAWLRSHEEAIGHHDQWLKQHEAAMHALDEKTRPDCRSDPQGPRRERA